MSHRLDCDAAPVDTLTLYRAKLVKGLENDQVTISQLKSKGMPYRGVMEALKRFLPPDFEGAHDFVLTSVPLVLDSIFGKNGWKQESKPSKSQPGRSTNWIIIKQ